MTAHVLSQEGRPISVEYLWQGEALDSPLLLAADANSDHPWSVKGLDQIVGDWVLGGLLDRRRFLAISGAGLLAAVSSPDPLVAQVDQDLPLLQLLDDANGGARRLPYVGAQFRASAAPAIATSPVHTHRNSGTDPHASPSAAPTR